jgi:hypothetical protein
MGNVLAPFLLLVLHMFGQLRVDDHIHLLSKLQLLLAHLLLLEHNLVLFPLDLLSDLEDLVSVVIFVPQQVVSVVLELLVVQVSG